MPKQPAFEIHTKSHALLIFADGRIEHHRSPAPFDYEIIINRIPDLIAAAFVEGALYAGRR